MYPVSNDYITKIKSPVIRSRVMGTIGGQLFTDRNILEGSFTITNQCSGNEQVQIGQVYVGELNITLVGMTTLSRYTLNGFDIAPIYQLYTANGWESIPLGHYYVGEANHTATGIVIKAYDAMSKLDKACTIRVASGTPYELASFACSSCQVSFGMTPEQMANMANGRQILTMYQDGTDIETWRDFLSWVAQACACFATCDRSGNIIFRAYGTTGPTTIETTQRFLGASFSDFQTKYTGIYVTNIADQTMEYYSLPQDDGLTYSLGPNPFLQYGNEQAKQMLRGSVLVALSRINYVPFKLELVDDPRYDLGDPLSIPGGIGDDNATFCITKYVWTHHRSMILEGVGKNPALATAQSKTDKNIQGLISQMHDDTTLHYYYYTNQNDLRIVDGATEEIIHLAFVTTTDTHIDFHCELKVEIDSTEDYEDLEDTYYEHDVTGTVTYYLGEDQISYQPLFTEVDGIQLRHLIYTWQASANVMGDFIVRLTAEGGDIIIKAGDINAYWAGDGLVGEVEDTNPKIEEDVPRFSFDLFKEFTDSVSMETEETLGGNLSDEIDMLEFVLFDFTEDCDAYTGIMITTEMTTEAISDQTVPVDGDIWRASADSQYLETIDLTGVTGVYAPTGTALSYMCSFDSGATWKGWDGSAWQNNLLMTYETVSTIPAASFGSRTRVRLIFETGETCAGVMIKGGHL